jgi:hypothetical protein
MRSSMNSGRVFSRRNSVRLALEREDPDALVVQLALFVHDLPALSEFVATHGLAESG